MSEQTLIEVHKNGPGLPNYLVERKTIHKHRIFCQWKHPTRDRWCVACWAADLEKQLSNDECFAMASEEGFIFTNDRVECGNHGEDEED